MKYAGQAALGGEFKQGSSEISRRANLPVFIQVKAGNSATRPEFKKFFVHAAPTGQAVTEEQGSAHDGRCSVGRSYEPFGFYFLAAIQIDRAWDAADGVWRIFTVENLFRRDMNKTRMSPNCRFGQGCGKDHVQSLRSDRVGIARGGFRNGGGVDDDVGLRASHPFESGAAISKTDRVQFGRSRNSAGPASDQADHGMACCWRLTGNFRTDQAGCPR